VARQPGQAASALVKALVARMEPPPRSREWHLLDWMGMVFQMVVVGAVLAARCLLGLALSGALPNPPGFHILSPLSGLLSGSPTAETPAAALVAALALLAAAVWFAAEAAVLPLVLEHLRRFPALRRSEAPPLAWRTDTFYLVWFGQAVFWMAVAAMWSWVLLLGLLFGSGSLWTQRVLAVPLAMVPAAIVIAAAHAAPRVLQLGTQREHKPPYAWLAEHLPRSLARVWALLQSFWGRGARPKA